MTRFPCSDLAAAPGSRDWFRGGVVAYDRTTERGVLGVPDGPVVSEPAVRSMADWAADMLGAVRALRALVDHHL